MRDILFRAKRIDNGEWVEGDLRQDRDLETAYISGWDYYTTEGGLEREPFEYEIKPETLCQYTELEDKNGKRIWENDIIIFSGVIIHIKWSGKDAGWCLVFRGSPDEHFFGGPLKPDRCKVIGNIFDNPELLKGDPDEG